MLLYDKVLWSIVVVNGKKMRNLSKNFCLCFSVECGRRTMVRRISDKIIATAEPERYN